MKKAFNLSVILVALFHFIDQSTISSEQLGHLSATEILKRVENRYSSITTYQDKGIVSRDSGTVKFETFFSKPESLLFKWEKTEKVYFPDLKKEAPFTTSSALKSYKGETYIFYYYKGDLKKRIEKCSDLKNAIPLVTGISWTAALYIPSLIFKEINKSKLTNLREAHVIRSEDFGNKVCHVIIGTWLHNETKYKVWIEKDSFIIKKIIRDDLTTYMFDEVIVDKNIPNHIFEFKPNPQP